MWPRGRTLSVEVVGLAWSRLQTGTGDAWGNSGGILIRQKTCKLFNLCGDVIFCIWELENEENFYLRLNLMFKKSE